MSYQSDNLDLEILEEGDPADLTTISDNFDKIDAVAGDIATIETSPTQSSHAAGEFLLYEGRLYKVTSAISAGASLVLGTNVSAANIGSELKSLRDSVLAIFGTSKFSSDLNTATNGIFGYSTSTSNRPSNFGVALCVNYHGSDNSYWIFQLAFSTYSNAIYKRMKINTDAWTAWVQM